jgi:glycosyltransferase involved in cell wall biosynthesis
MAVSPSEQLVSVVVPAYNAEQTLPETLYSVRAQTHENLEIIVVDDGSTDATATMVRLQQRSDPRIRLIQQQNAGVAPARNCGAAAATGAFIAPIDSDDLWHPTKIEAQLREFARAGPEVGVVYTWFALIDVESKVIHKKHRPEFTGWVLPILAEFNFVGNGSSPLIRTEAFLKTPGYDATLKARGGQGCEDWKLYCQLAERFQYAVVRDHLTGYRTLPDNMSSNVLEMLRSRDLATADLQPEHPELNDRFRLGRNRLSRFMLHRALRRGSLSTVISLLTSMAAFDRSFMLKTLAGLPREVSELIYSKTVAVSKGGGAERFASFVPKCREKPRVFAPRTQQGAAA